MQAFVNFGAAGFALFGNTYAANVIRLTHNDNRCHYQPPNAISKSNLSKFDPAHIDARAKRIAVRVSAWHKRKRGQFFTADQLRMFIAYAKSKITCRYFPGGSSHHDLHDEFFGDRAWLRPPQRQKPHLRLIS